MSMSGAVPRINTAALSLNYPLSLAIFDTYEAAQKAVDTLSDKDFPVQNCLIVGTDLKKVERVTGRLTRGKVALGGLLSGIWLGVFVGLIFALFDEQGQPFATILSTMAFGAVFGVVWAMIGYSLTGGQRDFTSVSQIVATRYEILCEHKYAQQAREVLVGAGLIQGYAAQSTTAAPAVADTQPPPPTL